MPSSVLHGSFRLVVAIALVGASTCVNQARVIADETTQWLQLIEQSKSELDANRLPSAEETEADVVASMDAAEAFFQRVTDPSNHDAWMKFLDFGPLRSAIENNESVAKRGNAAVELSQRLSGPEEGLELSRLIALRDSVDRYLAALRYGDPKRGLAVIDRQLTTLSEILSPNEDTEEADGSAPRSLADLSGEEVARIESIVDALAAANQASGLVSRITGRYSSPNLRAFVDGRVISDAITRPVNNPERVNDCLLGTRIIGDARVVGNVTGSLLPSEGNVRLLIRLDGQFSTSTKGYNGPVTLRSSGFGQVYAARQLVITEKRIFAGEPIATASLSTQINQINHPLKLVRKIASKKAAEMKPQAEAISRKKLQDRVLEGFREQTDEASTRTFPDLDAKMSPWLRRLDLPAPVRTIGSTTDAVHVRATMRRPFGLSAPGEAPSLSTVRTASSPGTYPGGYSAAVQVHESILNNTVMKLLAGDTFTPEKLRDLTSSFGIPSDKNDTTDEASATNEEQPESFEVDFSGFRPVYFEARDQTLRIGLRGDRFAQGDRELDRRLEVSAAYRPAITEDGRMMLVRDEEIDLKFPGGRRLTMTQTAIKANIEEGFDKLFPMTLLHREWTLPSTLQLPTLAGRSAKVIGIDAQDGWLTIVVR
ncbi:hypothetical protein [Rhodopirellula bahusiensis]|uniref:Uncharacterized protein n=1 Tax=Rhodopirellula bahusiensis TaxID=2014065 RepID=A0A2G1WD03_9BACT|nr:hypothetical protein [Rhodopirellula bahusiensis]PHQ36924.1 hypothetical protein CEE69_00630 [Rhodopirellula bahusiensis]